MKVRQAAFAGHFYPSDKDELTRLLKKLVVKDENKKIEKAFAMIAPHAGYAYSGQTAGKTYASVSVPDIVFVLSPNHTGIGHPLSLDSSSTWVSPLGPIDVDTEILNKLHKRVPEAVFDNGAQLREHALEVHIPFIQTLNPNAKIVPITLSCIPFEFINKLSVAIADIVMEVERVEGFRPLIVASSDMSHFESEEVSTKKDQEALKAIMKLDAKVFLGLVEKKDLSLCGIYPIAVTIQALLRSAEYTKQKPAVELIDYTNSSELTGDKSNVVAYAGLVFHLI
jgi:AmmeMemoRadiSam system protein B